ncbi:MAG: hypothetical protein FWC76_06750 [Defluviitaleaceae bacterium]|nr:hypothetical protein [Defluviitaleaceae bacterium]
MQWNKHKILVALSIGAGLISGVLRPAFMADAALDSLIASLHHFAATFDAQNIGTTAFFEGILRYGRAMLLIWACAMLPKAHYAALLVLYLRAMSLAFSAAMMVAAFGGAGFMYAVALYGLQNLIIMPLYAYTVYFMAKNDLKLAIRPPDNFTPVVKLAALGLGLMAAVSAIEAYVSPMLFEMLR